MNRIEEIINALESYVSGCKQQAFSSTKIICEKDALLEQIRELRAKMPEELTRVQKIVANQEAILENARQKAKQIINEAKNTAEEMIEDHQITKDAQDKADLISSNATNKANDILTQAISDSTNIRVGSINYTENMLKTMHTFISEAFEQEKKDSQAKLSLYSSQLLTLDKDREDLQRQLAHISGENLEEVAQVEDVEDTYTSTRVEDEYYDDVENLG